jgi:hypothetical protein
MLGNITKIPDIVVGDIRIYTKGTNVNLRSEPNTASKVIATVAASGTETGRYAGYYANDATNLMYKWYEFFDGKYGRGWIRNDLATMKDVSTSVTPPKNDDAEAQQMLDDIVAQDVETMNNLNTAAAMIENLQAKGVNTATSANKLTAIFARLKERQNEMEKPTTWGKVKGTISNAWGSVKNFFGFRGIEGLRIFPKLKNSKIAKLHKSKIQKIRGSAFPKFRRMRKNNPAIQEAQTVPEVPTVPEVYHDTDIQHDTDMQGVGAVITLTTIAIIAGIAVVAGGGATALVLCKPWKNRSNIDLKESRELKTLLENADPVVAQKIREDIKEQLVDAYTTGNRQGSVSSIMSIGKYVLIAGAALWLAPKLMNYFNKR